MIIENGTIEVKQKTVGQPPVDPQTGHAVKPTKESWGDPIPCQYVAITLNQLRRVNGEAATEATYHVYVEEQPFSAEQIRLKDRHGNTIGEFSVIRVEPLEAVCELRIWI